MKINQLTNKKIAILGFGIEGKSTLSFLLSLNISPSNITILDHEEPGEHITSGVLCDFGDSYLSNLVSFDIIIKSPGISPYHPQILPYKDKLCSQAEIFFGNYKGKVIGITGTKGKTTTVSILYNTLKNAGYSIKLVGNIGNPVLEEISLINNSQYDYVIYELSSYMLEGFVPKTFIGVLGNIFPDHLNWHNNSMQVYQEAKLNILKDTVHQIDGRIVLADTNNILTNVQTPLLGEHNIRNISLVAQICKIIGVPEKTLRKTVKDFMPIPHRLEKIAEKKGIIFIDDAISTTPESTIEAIKTFGSKIGTIFLGGLDRGGYNFIPLVNSLELYNIKNIVLFPETGKIIKKLLNNSKYNYIETASMKEAVVFAFNNCKQGEICLLSTASPSYKLYKNYIKQGEDFKKCIETT